MSSKLSSHVGFKGKVGEGGRKGIGREKTVRGAKS